MGEQWSVEHYGFPSAEPEPVRAATRPPPPATVTADNVVPDRAWDKGRLLLAGGLAAVVLVAGTGGFTVGHAVAGPPANTPAASTDRGPDGRDLRH